MPRSLGVIAAIVALIASGAGRAEVPADIAARLQEIGRAIDPPQTAALYAPLQMKEPYSGVKVERDLTYGDQERNRLDAFAAEAQTSGPKPVLIFVHGGGFIRGDKRAPGSPFYDNVMLWAVKNGLVGVNATYRLAPQSQWPAAAEDVAAVVRWVSGNIASRGGDPGRIYLMGHSAGAVHVAGYLAHPEFHGPNGSGLAGAVLVSGLYQLTQDGVSEAERAYFGKDPATYADRSSLSGLIASDLPLLLAAAELDPPPFIAQFELLKGGSCTAKRGCVKSVMLRDHSHMSEVYAINTLDNSLSEHILGFIKDGR